MIIRELKPEDNKDLAIVIRRTLEEFKVDKPGTVYFDESTDHLSDIFTVNNSAYFVVELNGEVMGGAGFYPTEGLPDDTVELVKMYLSSGIRRKGVGQILLEKCMLTARNLGVEKMYIETMKELTFAISMYEKNGFYHLSKPIGSTGHTGCDVWMTKNIT
ncbi:MAG: GNAT family N-acetyltransferase [Ginsengibacter sp.]